MQEKTEYAINIATRVRTAEHELDATIAAFSLLSHDMTRYRAEAGFAAQMGHMAFLEVHQALGGLVQVRSTVISAHNRLAKEARKLGLDIALMGPETKPEGGFLPPMGRLIAA